MAATSVMLIPMLNGSRMIMNLRGLGADIVHPGKWAGFGGYIEPRESALEALSREVNEETGQSLGDAVLLGNYMDLEGRGDEVATYVTYELDPNSIRLGEGIGFGVFDIEAIGVLDVVPFIRRAVSDLVGREF